MLNYVLRVHGLQHLSNTDKQLAVWSAFKCTNSAADRLSREL